MSSLTSFSGSVPQNYETYLGPLFFEPYATDLAQRLGALQAMNTILEIACGTGRVTRHLADKLLPGAQLVATDLNPDMLSMAMSIVPSPQVQWQVADAHSLPFDAGVFDAVICQYGIMFFQDKPQALREIGRVLKPGGTFLFNTWDKLQHNSLAQQAQTVLEELYPHDPPHFLDKGPYSFHDKDQIQTLLTQAGFSAIRIEVVAKSSTAVSADDAVKGILDGTPNFSYIAERNLPAATAREKLKVSLIRHFGETNLVLPMQALVVKATKS
jgi:ubiquinone/menaquinone biosynthesis C-methylase UbiE